jgi:hypothetical protein
VEPLFSLGPGSITIASGRKSPPACSSQTLHIEFDGEDGIARHGTEDEGSVNGIAKEEIVSETTQKHKCRW